MHTKWSANIINTLQNWKLVLWIVLSICLQELILVLNIVLGKLRKR